MTQDELDKLSREYATTTIIEDEYYEKGEDLAYQAGFKKALELAIDALYQSEDFISMPASYLRDKFSELLD